MITFVRKFWWLWSLLILIIAVLLTQRGVISDQYDGLLILPLIYLAFIPDSVINGICCAIVPLIGWILILIWKEFRPRLKVRSTELAIYLTLLLFSLCSLCLRTMSYEWNTTSYSYEFSIDYALTISASNGQTYYLANLYGIEKAFEIPGEVNMLILLECDGVSIFCRKIFHSQSYRRVEENLPQLQLSSNNVLSVIVDGETLYEKQLTDE